MLLGRRELSQGRRTTLDVAFAAVSIRSGEPRANGGRGGAPSEGDGCRIGLRGCSARLWGFWQGLL